MCDGCVTCALVVVANLLLTDQKCDSKQRLQKGHDGSLYGFASCTLALLSRWTIFIAAPLSLDSTLIVTRGSGGLGVLESAVVRLLADLRWVEYLSVRQVWWSVVAGAHSVPDESQCGFVLVRERVHAVSFGFRWRTSSVNEDASATSTNRLCLCLPLVAIAEHESSGW